MNTIRLVKGDIITARVDAIVNAANQRMLGGGGVDGAIHRAAGPQLLEECLKVKSNDGIRCPTGEARITLGCNLKAKFVIHTAGPRYNVDNDPKLLLTAAYKNCLNLAVDNNCHSIAFPAISCGIYGYPADEAAQVALNECQRDTNQCLDIYFYLYDVKTFEIWNSILNKSAS